MAMQNNLDAIPLATQDSKEAIHACLANVFNEEEMTLALKSWALHTNGASSEFSGVNSFAREICTSLNKPEKYRDLAKALNRALIMKYSPPAINKLSKQDLAEAPEGSPSNSILTRPKLVIKNLSMPLLAENATFDFLTFQLVLLTLIKHIALQNKVSKSKAITFLNEITETMPWSEIQQEQILALVNNGSIQPARTYKADQLKNFLKYFKLWMVDEMGLTNTTEIIDQVIAEVATMEEVKEFDPKSLFSH